MYAKQTGVISQLIKFIPHGYMSSYMQMEGGGGGIETIWELHTLAVIKLVQQPKNVEN